jgi:TPR repeat protein
MLILGREGVAKDRTAAFELVKEGTRLDCHHCQGVMANCYKFGYGCEKDVARSLKLAQESSGMGSKYGQWVLGLFYHRGEGDITQDHAQALALYRLAAAHNLDLAQNSMGIMYDQDKGEALQWYQLAAAQGYPLALGSVTMSYMLGYGVTKDERVYEMWKKHLIAVNNKK